MSAAWSKSLPRAGRLLPGRWLDVAVASLKDRIVDFFGWFKEHRGWAAFIAVVNLVGIAYGF
jgi:hypothetical protein